LQAYFVRWFISPVVSSFADPAATSYTYPLRVSTRTPSDASDAAFDATLATHPFPQALLFDDATWNAPGNRVTLSAVVPAYNEEERVESMLTEALEYLDARRARDSSFTFEVLFVDDGSRDGTAALLQRVSARRGAYAVRVLKLQANQGKGGAVQQGMLHARGELLLMVDADGATRFSDLGKLETALLALSSRPQARGHGIAVGSRKHLQSDAVATRKWYRNVLMYGFHFLVSTLTGISHIADTQCGFKLFTRPTAQYLFVNQHLRRWCFDVELLFLSVQAAGRWLRPEERQPIDVVEVAVNWTEIPGSKIDLIQSSLLMGRDLVIIRAAYTAGVWKFCSFDYIRKHMLHQKDAGVNAAVRRESQAALSAAGAAAAGTGDKPNGAASADGASKRK